MFMVALLAAAPTPSVEADRARYEDCMTAYAQVEMMGTKSTVTIAIEATEVCARERAQLTRSLLKSAPVYALVGIEAEQAKVVRRVIAFMNRFREGGRLHPQS